MTATWTNFNIFTTEDDLTAAIFKKSFFDHNSAADCPIAVKLED